MRLPLLVVALVLAAGCLERATEDTPSAGSPTPATLTPSPSPSPSPSPTPGPAAFRMLASGQQAQSHYDGRLAFYDAQEYEAFWASVREDPEQPAPVVDFTEETVVAVVSDARPDACWALRVTNATQESTGTTRVEVTTYTPPPDRMCASVITYPWHLVALDGADRTVAFSERETRGPPAS